MQNKLTDLNNHLFAQIERLNDEDLTGEKLESEIARAKAVTSVAGQIIQNGNLALRAAEFKYEAMGTSENVPKFLEG